MSDRIQAAGPNFETHSVLDHGYVKLIDDWGSDERIVEAARMSTGKGFLGWGPLHDEECTTRYPTAMGYTGNPCNCDPKPGDEKLLKYLWENRHATPFEMAGMTIEVQAPIFVFREWHRHRTQCLVGSTPLVFQRPRDGRASPMLLADVVRKWQAPVSKNRLRAERTQQDYARERLSAMSLRAPGGDVHLTDAWHSGEKNVYRVRTKYGQVAASADHRFKTPDGESRVADGLSVVMAMVSVGDSRDHEAPVLTEQELSRERWREFADGYEVSDLGRVRSYWTTRRKRVEPKLKTPVVNSQGRVVVGIHGTTAQVSALVCAAFIGDPGDQQVLHVDDNPLDNRVGNLYVGSPKDNVDDQYGNGGRRRLREVPVKVLGVDAVGREDTYDISVTGDHWFVADNLVVHNSYNEMSARYTPLPDLNYIPTVERLMMNTAGTNKQAGTVKDAEVLTEIAAIHFRGRLEEAYGRAEEMYRWALERGVPKELARIHLPVGRYSRMRASANLRNWLAFLTLRMDKAAQWEIRQYANVVGELISGCFPRTWALFTGTKS